MTDELTALRAGAALPPPAASMAPPAVTSPPPPRPSSRVPGPEELPESSPGHQRRRPRVFVSYARKDRLVVDQLCLVLREFNNDVWMDPEIKGGSKWWSEILTEIRAAEVFVFAMSPASVRSGACRAEVGYAAALQIPIVPVKVGDVEERDAPDPVPAIQSIVFRPRDPKKLAELHETLSEKRQIDRAPFPVPLPTPPAPMDDLTPLKAEIASPELDDHPDRQKKLVEELKQQAAKFDQHLMLLELIESFLTRDVFTSVEDDLKTLRSDLLRSGGVSADELPPPPPRQLDDLDGDLKGQLRAVADAIEDKMAAAPGRRATSRLTPVLGRGMTTTLLGMDELPKLWVDDYGVPTRWHRRRSDLPLAAQFVEVKHGVGTLRSSLRRGLRSNILEHYPEVEKEAKPGATPADQFNEMLIAAWKRQRSNTAHDPHTLLARLDCPVYVTAEPWALMSAALEEEGKKPVIEVCRWRPGVTDWPPSRFDAPPAAAQDAPPVFGAPPAGAPQLPSASDAASPSTAAETPESKQHERYEPSVEEPLVYHVFGQIATPQSLVLSADDYLDFLVSVAKEPELIPSQVRSWITDTAVVLLGFGLEDMDVRVLVRALLTPDGGRQEGHTHLGTQADFDPRVIAPDDEREYLEEYFGRAPNIRLFWGTVEEFAAGLVTLLPEDIA